MVFPEPAGTRRSPAVKLLKAFRSLKGWPIIGWGVAGYSQQPTEEEIESMDITLVNLILASVVVVLGIWAYARKKAGAALLVGMAFGLFAIAHLCDSPGTLTHL